MVRPMRFNLINLTYLSGICITVLLASSCRSDNHASNASISSDTLTEYRIDLTNPGDISVRDLWTSIEIIPLETGELGLISSPDKVQYRNNTYYVLDQNQYALFLFSEEGLFINKIQQQGRGPGEYLQIEDFEINPFTGNIELLNPRGEILVYDPNCNFLEKINIPLRASHFFTSLSPDTVVIYSIFEDKKINYFVRGNDSIYKKEHSFYEFIYKVPVVTLRSPLYRYGDEVYFLDVFNYSIKRFNNEELTAEFFLNFGEQNIDFATIPKDKELPFYVNYLRTSNYTYALENFIINDSLIILRSIYKRVWHTVMIDRITNEIKVIKRFKEDVVFPSTFDFCDAGIYAIVEPVNIELLVNEGILDDANSKKLEEVGLDSNPVIIKYHFKDQL
jgi:hypothetical protein